MSNEQEPTESVASLLMLIEGKAYSMLDLLIDMEDEDSVECMEGVEDIVELTGRIRRSLGLPSHDEVVNEIIANTPEDENFEAWHSDLCS
jgi:hypothetical protein